MSTETLIDRLPEFPLLTLIVAWGSAVTALIASAIVAFIAHTLFPPAYRMTMPLAAVTALITVTAFSLYLASPALPSLQVQMFIAFWITSMALLVAMLATLRAGGKAVERFWVVHSQPSSAS